MKDEFLKLDKNVYWTTSTYEIKRFLIAKNEEMRVSCYDDKYTTIGHDIFACARSNSYIHENIKDALYKEGLLRNTIYNIAEGVNSIMFIPKGKTDKTKKFPTFMNDTWDYVSEYEDFYIAERDVRNYSCEDFKRAFGEPIKFYRPDDIDELKKRMFKDSTPDVFDLTTTEMNGYEEDLLNGRNLDYLHNKKNLKGRIVYMSPNEYYREASKVLSKVHEHNVTPQALKEQRNADPSYIKELEEVITKKHKKFPIPYLNVSDRPGQEGLHRMMAVGNLYGWDTKFPVLLVENYSKVDPKKVLEDIVEKAKSGSYRSWNAVVNYLNDMLVNSIFYQNFNVDFNDEETQIIVSGEYNDKDYTAYEDIEEFDVYIPKDEDFNEELSQKDLDEIDNLLIGEDDDL